jgi:hypothetical protein
MLEDFNLPFHGMLLDPLIEVYCGPVINYDSCSTFDETSLVLASPSFVIFNGEYQLTFHQTQHLYSLATSKWNS